MSMTETALAVRIPDELAGRRLDQALAQLLPDYSRSRLTAWIRAGQVRVDGDDAIPRQLVIGGEEVTVQPSTDTVVRTPAEDIALDILHADDDVFVINKPAGLVAHPGAGNPDGTLLNALLHADPQLAKMPRGGIVHRLDRLTSGIMVVARTLRAHTTLVEQLSARTMHRQYEAVVYGPMVAGGTVDAPIGRHPRDRVRQAVTESGRPAKTHYRVRERYRTMTRIECVLESGRTHQIRVHMAHVRHPLVGDSSYGRGIQLPKAAGDELVETLQGFRRQALHAEQVAFQHPDSGELVTFNAPRPDDLTQLIRALRADTLAHAQ